MSNPEDVSCPYCGGRSNPSGEFDREYVTEHGNHLQTVAQLWEVRECLDCRETFATLEKEATDA